MIEIYFLYKYEIYFTFISATRLFSKSIDGNFLNFLHDVEKMISVIGIQV